MDSMVGSLLVAAGSLFDPNFRRTVVLVAEHGDEGALGLVLNRPADATVEEAAPALAGLVPPGSPVFLGGPVRPEAAVVLAEFEDPALAGKTVLESIGFPPDDAEPDELEGVRRARVFAGHAGWGPGQLERELEESAWIVDPAGPEDIFSDHPEELWAEVLRRKGGKYRMLALMPFDPSTN
ncbi:MAG: YqgE/AlgH family protein [Actinomycetota bacterium]